MILIVFIVSLHLIEINILDPFFTKHIQTDYALIVEGIENGYVAQMTSYWHPLFLSLAVFIYILLYPFLLWFTPAYAVITKHQNILKKLALGLTIIYTIALPFYLFVPITNVYLYHQLPSALEQIIPTINQFYYTTTSSNNTLPSLHVAMSLFLPYLFYNEDNKRFFYLTIFVAAGVLISVLYLAIHWIIDVIAGVIVAATAIKIVQYLHRENDACKKTEKQLNKE